ncbi:MAG: hypothetical protein CBB95_15465 [Alteromonas sp. TMED35]|nr:MAG: hypothetical protein CBB95_15465 [Alteromonas sp. TMED35]HIM12169.1 hypothetical protein [Candidatus Poribacteria bacterium]|tara:strand:+ start:5343 stop:6014 length:672 start_codon:yes stop_codon:yes gene_type:complete
MKTRILFCVALALSGCASKPQMSDAQYSTQARFWVQMEKCRDQTKITSVDYQMGFSAMNYELNTWDYDVDKFIKETHKTRDLWKNTTLPDSYCENIKQIIGAKVAGVKQHKYETAIRNERERIARNNALAQLSKIGQQINEAGRQALSSVQNTSSTPSYPPSSTPKTPYYPTPQGYERSYSSTGTVGVLRNTRIESGSRLCEYSNGQAVQIPVTSTCPQVKNF